MGLLLSVLVACVGVAELLAFYFNVTRNFVTASTTTTTTTSNIADITRKYYDDLQALPVTETATIQTLSVTSEDIELEIPRNVIRSSSPRRFLLTEKKDPSRRACSKSPRRFLVSNPPEDEDTNTNNNLVPSFIVEEETSTSTEQRQFVLKNKRARSPIPLPEQFIVTEPKSRSPSPAKHHEEFKRSASPYPPLVLPTPTPRNSICSELLDNPKISVVEVDEEGLSKSPTPERIDKILESQHRSTEFWTNKVLVVKSASVKKKQRSCSPSPVPLRNLDRRKSKSDNNFCLDFNDEDNNNNNNDRGGYDEKYLDSLDGVKRKKLTRSRTRSKKRMLLENGNCSKSSDDFVSSSSAKNNETAKTLTAAASVLKSANDDEKNGRIIAVASASSSSDGGENQSRTVEPFWLIFSGEYTKAMNKDWHGQHFCCWQCDESLTGQRYVLRDDHPYCVSCYESVFANACEKCSRTIGIDSKDLSYKDKHWHEACFLCTTCGESLVDKQFGSKGDRIYCGRCYDEQFASRCDGCHEIFRAGTKKMEYKTRQWHEKCFCCCVCKVPIGTQSFIPREQEIYCAKCYEEKFATRCIKCNKVITSGGVTYKNEPWHRECFTCTHCSKSLAGERFTSRDEKPYCAECFGELFAKRCFACNKPITGIGGTKFISFEDRHWHNDCFFCASCRTSLVGRGFITDQEDIICPDCAKQKLM